MPVEQAKEQGRAANDFVSSGFDPHECFPLYWHNPQIHTHTQLKARTMMGTQNVCQINLRRN